MIRRQLHTRNLGHSLRHVDELHFVRRRLLRAIRFFVFWVPDGQVVPYWVDEAVVVEEDQRVVHVEGVRGRETGSDSV